MSPPPQSATQSQIDSTALEKATEALTRIAMHERSCDRRYEEISNGQKAIFNKIDGLNESLVSYNNAQTRRWLAVSGGIIAVLLTVVGYLFARTQGWIS